MENEKFSPVASLHFPSMLFASSAVKNSRFALYSCPDNFRSAKSWYETTSASPFGGCILPHVRRDFPGPELDGTL